MSETKYLVGTKVISTVDNTRAEELGPMTGSRVVSARLYYPAKQGTGSLTTVPDAIGTMYKDAEPVGDEQFPIIVYNHGYGLPVESNNYLCCELAAEGYLVIAVGHAYEASEITMENGTVIKQDKNVPKKMMKPAIPAMVAMKKLQGSKGTHVELYKEFLVFQRKYASFMVDRLDQWAKDILVIVADVKSRYPELIDIKAGIGITGHSFGGNMAYYMCHKYDGYKCGINIDGPLFGHFDDNDMTKPFLQICSSDNVNLQTRSLFGSVAPVYHVVFKNLDHVGFTDKKLTAKSKSAFGSMPPEVMGANLNSLNLKFFNKYLKFAGEDVDMTDSEYIAAKKIR